MANNYKICFIIACRIVENYDTFIIQYVENINKYYENNLIILVDNNSKNTDLYNNFKDMKNVILLTNNSECKYELGAYKVGYNYIISNNLNYDYYVCVQDLMMLNKKFDFNELILNNIKACSIYTFGWKHNGGKHYYEKILTELNMYNKNEEFLCCWCASWICDFKSLVKINSYTKNIKITCRDESMATERYIGKILYVLNDNKYYSIDGDYENINYEPHSVNLLNNNIKKLNYYFVKKCQHKNENTKE